MLQRKNYTYMGLLPGVLGRDSYCVSAGDGLEGLVSMDAVRGAQRGGRAGWGATV